VSVIGNLELLKKTQRLDAYDRVRQAAAGAAADEITRQVRRLRRVTRLELIAGGTRSAADLDLEKSSQGGDHERSGWSTRVALSFVVGARDMVSLKTQEATALTQAASVRIISQTSPRPPIRSSTDDARTLGRALGREVTKRTALEVVEHRAPGIPERATRWDREAGRERTRAAAPLPPHCPSVSREQAWGREL
jgi:hypothetical protein